eukprot:1595147-Lingulodinium_polyedra.AAC.1
MKCPAASAVSSSTASSHASSSAPRSEPPPQLEIHAETSLARPAAQTRYAIGRSQMGRRCMGSRPSPPGFGSSSPSGPTPGQTPAASTAS